MAQDYTDFSEYSTGTFPTSEDGWSVELSSSEWEIISDSSRTGGQALDDSVLSGGSYDSSALSWKSGTDVEVVAKIYDTGGEYGQYLGQVVRGGGTASSPEGYGVRTDASDVNIVKYDGSGNTSIVASAGHSISSWNPYWVRLRANSSTLQAKAWEGGNAEPSSWMVETTDPTWSNGFVGPFVEDYASFSTVEHEHDEHGVGTNGDSAPKSAGSAPAAPSGLTLTLQ